VLTGSNASFNGTMTVDPTGILQGTASTVMPAITNNGLVDFVQPAGGTYAGTITGTGAVAKDGAGVLTLTGVNTYSGGTSFNAGTVAVSADNNLGAPTGPLTFNGGTLQLTNSFNLSASRPITLDALGGTIDMQGFTTTIAQGITGAGALTKAGVGTLVLSGNNTYAGGTNLNAGTLVLGNATALGIGTLAMAAGTTLDFLGSYRVGNAITLSGDPTINVNAGLTVTSTGTVTDGSTPGTLNKTGAGTLVLAAADTYTGGTAILAGTLQLGDGTTNGSIVGNVTNNATLAFDPAAGTAITYAGVISGPGAVNQIGTGTTILTGANTYTGATTIDAGTLQAGATNAFSPASAFAVASGATLDLNSFNQTIGSLAGAGSVTLGAATLTTGGDNTSTTFAGGISGSGGLIKTGTGTFTLSGANTYSGATTIDAGTLQAGATNAFSAASEFTIASGATLDLAGFDQTIGSLEGAGTVTLGSAELTVGGDNASTTFSGTISGTGGSLIKAGSGTLTLSGINSYTGPTSVNGGALFVDGSIASSSLTTVNGGATLGGSGTIGSTIVLGGGTFAPGPSNGTPGTMTVAGNLAFQSGAIYLVQVNSSTSTTTNVSGTATLAGTVQTNFEPGAFVQRSYTILSAAGGRIGTFDALAGVPPDLQATIGYTGTTAMLNLRAELVPTPTPPAPGPTPTPGPPPPAPPSFTINQFNVGTAIDNFFNNGGALPPTFLPLFELTGSNLTNALSQLSGEAATGAQTAAFQLGNQFLNLMLDPFVDGRSRIGATDHPPLGFAPDREPMPPELALAYASVFKAPPATVYEPRWTVWGGAYGAGNHTTGDPAVIGSHDLSARTAGFAAGFDYHFTPDTVAGFALAGGGTSWGLSDGLGGGRSDALQAGLYGATRWGPAYLAAAFAFTNHWMSTDRFAVGDHLTADFNAQSYGARLEGGYRFAVPFGGITPYAALQAQSFHRPAYAETDALADGFALAFPSRDANDTRSELGARFDRAFAVSPDAVLALRGRLAWAHDWVSDPTLVPLFQSLPGASFVVNGATPAKDSALTSVGAELRLANGITLLAKFDGEFASHSSTYAGTGTIRYSW
jgi:autotransporter-associated beta strand protein